MQGAESGCPTEREKQVILNCTRILSRILPYIFEDQDWRGFFWSTVPGAGRAGVSGHGERKTNVPAKSIKKCPLIVLKRTGFFFFYLQSYLSI